MNTKPINSMSENEYSWNDYSSKTTYKPICKISVKTHQVWGRWNRERERARERVAPAVKIMQLHKSFEDIVADRTHYNKQTLTEDSLLKYITANS